MQNVIHQFTALGRDPRVAFLGNVTVGRDVALPDLRAFYNAVHPDDVHTLRVLQHCSVGTY